jgi:hypothetical protein
MHIIITIVKVAYWLKYIQVICKLLLPAKRKCQL